MTARMMSYRRGLIRSAGRPRSKIRESPGIQAYAVTLDYYPEEDRIRVGYSLGRPVLPEPWLVAEEDPLEGLWLDPTAPIDCLLVDIPVARGFLTGVHRDPRERAAAEATDRLVEMLKELDTLI